MDPKTRLRLAAALTLAACGAALSAQTPPPATPAPGPPPGPHNIRVQEVVLVLPGMEKVEVRRDLPFGEAEGKPLAFDLYQPLGAKPGEVRPALILVNGIGDRPGDRIRDWGQFRSWARLAAASGFAAVVHDSRGGPKAGAEDLAALLDRLRKDGRSLGVDPDRLGLWAFSKNVNLAMPFLMKGDVPGVKAAVFYYGAAEVPSFRTDLPVLMVRAGGDLTPAKPDCEKAFAAALAANAPWVMINVPGVPHLFDLIDDSQESRDAMRATLAFLDERLRPQTGGAPPQSLARDGLKYWNLNQLEPAAKIYAQMLEKDPDDAEAMYRLGSSQTMIKDQEQTGLANLRKAVQMAPGNMRAWNDLGAALLAFKEYPEAIESLKKALELGAPKASVLYNLACAYAATGAKENALDSLAQAVDAGFNNAKQIAEDHALDALRSDPKFQELEKKAGSAAS